MTAVRSIVAACGILGLIRPMQEAPMPLATPAVRAKYLISVADDFVVDVYLNGKVIPDASRHLLDDRFGATAERIDVTIRQGDWLVFNVVNNRLRWDGARYFGVAGCIAKDEFSFVSDPAGRNWSACDEPTDVPDFISDSIFGAHRRALPVDHEWQDGTPLMKRYAGSSWNGKALWGESRNTWIKVHVQQGVTNWEVKRCGTGDSR